MSIFDSFVEQVITGDYIKDYKHATRLYRDFNYALAPKHGFLYHVFFDINPSLTFIARDQQIESGMLVKNVSLPKFNLDTKVLNCYNRPNVIQTKVKYDNISITFHDDMSNVVRNFWFDYYNYYYRDADNGYSDSSGAVNPNYYQNHKYLPGQRDVLNRFGYDPRTSGGDSRYLQAIRVYSLYKRQFSEYTLINPFILSFSHGDHNSDGATSILDHSMTIAYESILYASGYVTSNTVKGFADLHYDKSPSPLSALGGGINTILGPGGIVSAADSITKDVAGGNFGAAAFKAIRTYNKNKNTNLQDMAKGELIALGTNIIKGQDPRDNIFVPYPGSENSRTTPPTALNPVTPGASTGSLTSNGQNLISGGIAGAVATAATGNPLIGAAAGVITGVTSNSRGAITGAPINKLLNIGFNSPLALQSVENISGTYSYKKSLQQLAENRAAAVNAADLDNSGIYTEKTNTPIFTIGTNDKVANVNPLQQTPYSNKFIRQQNTVVNDEAAKFIRQGNPNEDFVIGEGAPIGGMQTNPKPS